MLRASTSTLLTADQVNWSVSIGVSTSSGVGSMHWLPNSLGSPTVLCHSSLPMLVQADNSLEQANQARCYLHALWWLGSIPNT